MGSKRPYRATPNGTAKELQQPLPPPLEVVEYFPPGKRPKKLVGGAYDPYERPLPTGDTVRVQKPRTDLRRLSAWIKTKNEVAANREGESSVTEKPRTR